MTTYHTRKIFIPEPSLIPPYVGQWGLDDSEWDPDWGTTREYHFMPWDSHIVAEGMVSPDDFNLKRALRDEGIC